MLLHYFTNYKKIGITLIILFFVPFIVLPLLSFGLVRVLICGYAYKIVYGIHLD